MTLKEKMIARKLEKRARLQEVREAERRGAGSRRRFKFKPLPFQSDRGQFDRCGGAEARQPLVPGWYRPEPTINERCVHLVAPEDFTFQTNLDGLLRFVYEMRRQVFIERRFTNFGSSEPKLYLNLDHIARVDLAGALILAAELDRLRKVVGFKPVLDDHNWLPEIRATLNELGLHDIIHARSRLDAGEVPGPGQGISSDRFQVIKMRSGNSSSNELAKVLRDELFEACRPFSVARPQIYNVLVEAFNNSREHAYPGGSGEDGIPSVRGWWAGALVDHQLGKFHLAVYDQGIGIPERFARQHDTSQVERQQPGGSGDLLVLRRAAAHGSSSTSDPGRGNGLWQMTELTRSIPGSQVEFTSLRGCVAYRDGILVRAFVPPQRFCGTIIRWEVPFRPQTGEAR